MQNEFDQKKLNVLRIKVNQLINVKNRSSAIALITESESVPSTDHVSLQLMTMKENLLSLFLAQKSQDLFESSASQMILKTRLSEKNILSCLDLEPENLFCRWQYLRVLNYKNDPSFRAIADQFIIDTEKLPVFGLLAVTLNAASVVIKEKMQPNLLKTYPVLFHMIEFERSIAAQNYSLSKEILQKIIWLAPDYPDIVFLRSKLMSLSQEVPFGDQNTTVLFEAYKKTCMVLRPELTRKYYYDINLCYRSH